jgi:putative flippase GtrA
VTSTTEPCTVPRDEARRLASARPAGSVVLDVVIPVHNEQHTLAESVHRVREHLDQSFPYRSRVTVVDNASTDDTWTIAQQLAKQPGVTAHRLDLKGRGRALHTAWSSSDATVLAYMDVDLSTDLTALLPLVAPLISGHSHVAIGSRLTPGSRVVRGPKRELVSRAYNLLLRGTLSAQFSDAQCGFKAIRADVARELVPLVEDTGWFFDTELLVLAERAGLRIHEVPVDWIDDPDSSVDIAQTALADLRGIVRVGRGLWSGRWPLASVAERLNTAAPHPGLVGQLMRFAAIGTISTLAYAALYWLLADPLGPQGANLAALLTTAIGNTAANRRVTFNIAGRVSVLRHQIRGLAVFGLGWALTSGSLALLYTAQPSPSRQIELTVLVLANLTATVLRFALLRNWVFRPRSSTGGDLR